MQLIYSFFVYNSFHFILLRFSATEPTKIALFYFHILSIKYDAGIGEIGSIMLKEAYIYIIMNEWFFGISSEDPISL